ncbi:MAG TPA: Gfo/Idh/MocA family oxidoreductase [Chloroflexota bacterium]|jgi:predicted dehydrogenase|nr:Gfo/Idh/MocA family oxidoreductase [Chloroflexota bacterium]
MRALIVGLGSAGRRHARNWAALGGDVWVCRQANTPQPEPLGVEVREFQGLEQALAAQPDAVIVTNPTSMHVETACAALRAGAHVLVEKPIGDSLNGVDELLENARGKVLMVGYNLRFVPTLLRMRELLATQVIGRPLSARAEVGEYLPDWHPWEDYRSSYSARTALGGGPVLTFSHEIDSLCWLLGAPHAVTAVARNASSLEIDTEDVAEIILEIPSGALASVHVDYVRRPARRSIEIVGEDGVLRWEYEANRVMRYAAGSQEWIVEEGNPRAKRNDSFLSELRDLQARVNGEPSGVGATGEQGAAVLAIALAALDSSAEGRRIDLSREPEPMQQWLKTL